MESITSASNPLLKRIRRLLESPGERRIEGVAVLEGAHLLEAYAARFGLKEATVLLAKSATSGEVTEVLRRFAAGRLVEVPHGVLNALSLLDSPTGVLALVPIPRFQPAASATQFWIVLDGVQDPGNVGSILRTAVACGATRALLSVDCADPWSPKCLRGGMGAQFLLPIEDHADLLEALKPFKGTVYAADARATRQLYDADLTGDTAILLGSEGGGLSDPVATQADEALRIPIGEGVESLNVAAAAAIICGERIRQMRAEK